MPAEGEVNGPRARILIVDDHPIVRQGMARLINLEDDLMLCCKAEDSDRALAAMQVCQHDVAIV
ncbi:MAG: DNA-binding response regulator, partial [Acidobacteria bacterium]|nr:DNA-binding response regulator [Acidobacteriota bacterium]